MARPVSRAELSRLLGVSAMAVTKWCKKNEPACIGKRVDLDHELTQAWFAAKEVQPPPPVGTPKIEAKPRKKVGRPAVEKKPSKASKKASEREPKSKGKASTGSEGGTLYSISREEIERDYGEWTLNQVREKFGTAVGFKDYLQAMKTLVDIREKDLKNAATEGSFITRATVADYVFAYIDGVQHRLLADAPRTIAAQLYANAKSGVDIASSEDEVRDLISREWKPLKTKISRTLRNSK